MELNSTYSSSRKWDFLPGSFREGRRIDWRSMAIYRFVLTWKKIWLPERPIINSFFLFFRKIEAKRNKSHRMQNTSTSRSTDFRRQKAITSKTPLILYGRGFCASDRTPTTTVRRPGPSQIKMYGFCCLFRAMEYFCAPRWNVLRAPAHEFAQHMYMKIETHARAHTHRWKRHLKPECNTF